MLDVHPPHEAAHTWKDFLIHVGTICVGLLIAVGLEQTVEYVHRAHQRRELREALRIDTEINNTWAKGDFDNLDRRRHWYTEQLTAIEHAGPTGALKLPRVPRMVIYIPNTGVWTASKLNGQAALLTVAEQDTNFDMDRAEDATFVQPTGSCSQYYDALSELDRQLLGRTVELPSGELDLSGLTPEQRMKLAETVRTLIISLRDFELDLLNYSTSAEYILTTPTSELEESSSLAVYNKIYARNNADHPDLAHVLQAR